MEFRDAFQHYKDGIATEEETAYVEAELEKHRLIAEFEEPMMPMPEFDEQVQEELRQVKSSLRKRTCSIIVFAVLIVAALAALTRFAVVPALERSYYNPTVYNEDDYSTDFDLLMMAYSELHHPGIIYDGTVVEKKGIGSYMLTLRQMNLLKGTDSYQNATLEKDELVLPASFYADELAVNIFAKASTPTYALDVESKAHFLASLASMPDYITVAAAVSFDEDLTMEQLVELQAAYPDLIFIWAGIRANSTDVQIYPLCGMDLTGNGVVLEKINEFYPEFDITYDAQAGDLRWDCADPLIYQNHFTSLLQYMIDHPELLDCLGGGNAEFYQNALSYVKEQGVNSYGVYVKGSPADICALSEDAAVSQVWPTDAEFSFY